MLQKFINSNQGRVILSILLGFGIATLLRKDWKDRNCLVFNAPSMDKVKGKTFEFDNKCHQYREKNSTCNPNKQILEMVQKNA